MRFDGDDVDECGSIVMKEVPMKFIAKKLLE